jgi:hypothetical protein
MNSLSVAEPAVLLEFKTVRVVALVLCGRIVSLLAVRACHCNDNPHDVHLPKQNLKRTLYKEISTPRHFFRVTRITVSQDKRRVKESGP